MQQILKKTTPSGQRTDSASLSKTMSLESRTFKKRIQRCTSVPLLIYTELDLVLPNSGFYVSVIFYDFLCSELIQKTVPVCKNPVNWRATSLVLHHRVSFVKIQVFTSVLTAFAPTFRKFPLQPNTYATQRGNVTLICRPEAAPAALKQWFRNERALISSPE